MRRAAACVAAFLLSERAAMAQETARVTRGLPEEIARTLIWLVIAGVLFFVAFKAVDLATPGDLKQQLADGNTAMAIFVGSLLIAAGIIIAALVA